MNKTTRMVSGHYEFPLPFNNDETTLPNNRYKGCYIKHLTSKFKRDLTSAVTAIKRMRRKISWLCRRRKMLVYLPSRSLQWDQAQRNESCFWLQHIISRKIAKQWTYVRFGFDQSNQWSVNQIQARTDCNNGWHRVDVSPSMCIKKTSKLPKISLVAK